MGMKFEIYNTPTKPCKRSKDDLYVTQYANLLVQWIHGGYNMNTGKRIDMPDATRPMTQAEADRTEPATLEEIRNGYTRPRTWIPKMREEISFSLNSKERYMDELYKDGMWVGSLDYNVHQDIKSDYISHQLYRIVRENDIKILQSCCELERNQMLLTLAMSKVNPQLAGYLLTGNRSNFITIDAGIAWLYDCKLEMSPLYVDTICYDKIPVQYNGEIKYVDPITREIGDIAVSRECGTTNLIQLDLDNDDSWYVLTPDPIKTNPPNMFKTKLTNAALNEFPEFTAMNAGLYTNEMVESFWRRVTSQKNSDTVATEFATRELKQNENHDPDTPRRGDIYNENNIFVNGKQLPRPDDSWISKAWFIKMYQETFGKINYIIQVLGGYIGFIIGLKYFIDILGITLRIMELDKYVKTGGNCFRICTIGILNTGYLAMIENLKEFTDDSIHPPSKVTGDITPRLKTFTQESIEAPPYTETLNHTQTPTMNNMSIYPNIQTAQPPLPDSPPPTFTPNFTSSPKQNRSMFSPNRTNTNPDITFNADDELQRPIHMVQFQHPPERILQNIVNAHTFYNLIPDVHPQNLTEHNECEILEFMFETEKKQSWNKDKNWVDFKNIKDQWFDDLLEAQEIRKNITEKIP